MWTPTAMKLIQGFETMTKGRGRSASDGCAHQGNDLLGLENFLEPEQQHCIPDDSHDSDSEATCLKNDHQAKIKRKVDVLSDL